MAKEKTKTAATVVAFKGKKLAASKSSQSLKHTATAIKAPRDSKAAQIVEALRQKDGASLDELMIVTGWQRHSVRGFLSAHAKKPDNTIEKFTRADGNTAYISKAVLRKGSRSGESCSKLISKT